MKMTTSKIVFIILLGVFVLGCFHSNKLDVETLKGSINEKDILISDLVDGEKDMYVVTVHCYGAEVQKYHTIDKPKSISKTTIFQIQDYMTKENILTSCPIKVKQITKESEIIDLIENLTIMNNITSI